MIQKCVNSRARNFRIPTAQAHTCTLATLEKCNPNSSKQQRNHGVEATATPFAEISATPAAVPLITHSDNNSIISIDEDISSSRSISTNNTKQQLQSLQVQVLKQHWQKLQKQLYHLRLDVCWMLQLEVINKGLGQPPV